MVGIAVLAFFLCTLNLIFWLVFLNKFKRLFSTDDIILSTKQEIARMLEDVNRVTSRDIDLIDSKIKSLKAAAAEAERHISVVKADFEKEIKLNQYSSLLKSPVDSRVSSAQAVKTFSSGYENLSDGLQSTKAYSITREGERQVEGEQGELFGDKNDLYVRSSAGTKFTVDKVGASVASIPKLGSNISFSDNPITPKKSINEKIKELSDQGYSIELIARELNLTTTEVQFSLDMGF